MRTIGLFAVALFGAGCSCEDDGAGGALESSLVGPEGGTLTSPDGRLEIRVPRGALDHDVALSVEEDPPGVEAPAGVIGRPYRLVPEGTVFAEPVTLLFHYDPDDLDGRTAQALRVATSGGGLAWSCIPMSGTDEDGGVVVAAVMHLSVWALRFNACDDDGDCTAPERCIEGGVCAIPCVADADCAGGGDAVLGCFGGTCNRDTCTGGLGCTQDRPVCSAADGPGICLPECDAGHRCGVPSEQQICTAAGRCVFDTECDGQISCDAIASARVGACLHGWCAPEIAGCDCADPACPCFVAGGEGEGEGEPGEGEGEAGEGEGEGESACDAVTVGSGLPVADGDPCRRPSDCTSGVCSADCTCGPADGSALDCTGVVPTDGSVGTPCSGGYDCENGRCCLSDDEACAPCTCLGCDDLVVGQGDFFDTCHATEDCTGGLPCFGCVCL